MAKVEEKAKAAGHEVRLLRCPLGETDRAIAEGIEEGLVKLVATPDGRLLGAGILAPHAGEMAGLFTDDVFHIGSDETAATGRSMQRNMLQHVVLCCNMSHYVLGVAARRRPREVHPSRLRLLDAETQHRRSKNRSAGEGAGSV
jgi:hypothetical protein